MVRGAPGKNLRRSLAGGIVVLLAGAGLVSAADEALITGEARYNLRRAPGADYRAVDLVRSGEEVTILERGEGWTRVRTASGSEGWIDDEHLKTDPPPVARVSQLETELAATRADLDKERRAGVARESEVEQLRARTAEAGAESARLLARAESLQLEARWREWITGAAILLVGIALGAILHRITSRRGASRLRL